MSETATAPLTGKALLAKVKELSSLPRRERAKQCGYYTVTKNSQVRVNLTDFSLALRHRAGRRGEHMHDRRMNQGQFRHGWQTSS